VRREEGLKGSAKYRMFTDNGKRHRISYVDGKPGYWIYWTDACSGCTADYEEIGGGCFECGYTGKTRRCWFVEIKLQPSRGRG